MPQYLNPAQQRQVERLLQTPTARSEWPTWLLFLVVYGLWFAAIAWSQQLGPWATSLLLILDCAWYMSFQHELVHGHPTRHRGLNKLLGSAPLAVWFPYTLYRESHLRHHHDAHLTLPGLDPETHYVSQQTWQCSGWFMRSLYWQRKRFWGALLLGPAITIGSTLRQAIRQPLQGHFRHLPMWLTHLSLLAAMLVAIEYWAGISPLHYLLGVAYPALSLAMVRSYYEHRAADDCKHRIVINEAAWPMRLLFLNNNYHLVHHDLPDLPWYLLPVVYRANREDYLRRCGGFLVAGYGELIRHFGLTPVDAPLPDIAGP